MRNIKRARVNGVYMKYAGNGVLREATANEHETGTGNGEHEKGHM